MVLQVLNVALAVQDPSSFEDDMEWRESLSDEDVSLLLHALHMVFVIWVLRRFCTTVISIETT